jgi:hypothetical protein
MAVPFLAGGFGRADRGLHGDLLAGGGDGLHPQGSAAEDGSGPTILLRDAKPPFRRKSHRARAMAQKNQGGGGK